MMHVIKQEDFLHIDENSSLFLGSWFWGVGYITSCESTAAVFYLMPSFLQP